ncbi:Distal-less homeobox 3 [Mycena sanguinolenta]|uniref:Distal-less homeobox 3 n=1 Tax=Mycena sanguinolenta TaxID=230812 RepID=A0A8H6XFB2_9AGAR|nr:Distal-less homeobox 3 [Mycena sanguinolenta]
MPPQKKPRHRHSPAQLAALAELYEQTEHPTLQQRIDLGSRIGLETKSVNSYFQNKRASTKKQRPRGAAYISSSSDLPPSQTGDSYPLVDAKPFFQPDVPNPSEFLSEPESMPQRMMMHSSLDQVDDPQKPYALHDERQGIADSQCESDTNWFPNPRTLSEEQRDANPAPEDGDLLRPFPPAPDQPSLTERGRRPDITSIPDDGLVSRSRRTSSRRSTTPYSSTSAVVSLSARQRRARPEPLQLDALKQLYSKTATPSIEERTALSQLIGMEVGKVTNWFRNLRQSARKRAKKVGRRQGGNSDDDMDYTDGYGTGFYSPSVSTPASRAGTPVTGRRAGRSPVPIHSSDDDEEDEEEPQEAVTPSPSQSPSPASSPSHARHLDFSVAAALHNAMLQMAKEERFKDLAADALLLLEFQATST